MPATQCVHMPTSEASQGASAAHSPTRPQRAHMPTICTTWPQLWQPLLPTHVRFILTTPSLGRTTRLVRLLALRLLIADLEVLGALDRLQADSLARGARQAQGDLLRGLCLWTGRSNIGAAQVSETCPTSSVPACSPDANLLCHHTQRLADQATPAHLCPHPPSQARKVPWTTRPRGATRCLAPAIYAPRVVAPSCGRLASSGHRTLAACCRIAASLHSTRQYKQISRLLLSGCGPAHIPHNCRRTLHSQARRSEARAPGAHPVPRARPCRPCTGLP